MTIRERLEQQEYMLLAPNAQKAAETKGRLYPAEENEVRTCYQRDADRIVHSKSFRRLMHKTQVFLSPEGDHYRTRMTHTLEVSRIARTICRALRLNEDLAEAAAYGHDLGHTPFGHAGEAALTDMMGTPFHHNEQSLRVVDKLERDGDGLNLTYEVRMAILGHTGSRIPETLEGQVVRTSDRIAYINHDIDDAIRAGILSESDIPREIADVLGSSHSARINTLVETRRTPASFPCSRRLQRRWTACVRSCLTGFIPTRSPRARSPRRRTSCASSLIIITHTRTSCRRTSFRSWTSTASAGPSATTLPA